MHVCSWFEGVLLGSPKTSMDGPMVGAWVEKLLPASNGFKAGFSVIMAAS